MNLSVVREITNNQMKRDLPDFGPGATVSIDVLISEGDKSRIQVFEGVVIQRSGSGVGETFTVRKISSQIGVERTFPVHSPIIKEIRVLKIGKVRRSKLNYLRKRSGRAARLTEKR
ncbi:MAG: 50S ribosomal protein L19 [Erysipelothrix sp.]|nr:50S ribosomal protein L19 [Erysipelothrix sp.]